MTITKYGDLIFEVQGEHSFVVDLNKWYCSCSKWFTGQFPCDHAIQCMLSSNISVYEFPNPFFSISFFRASYSQSINLIPNHNKLRRVAAGDMVLLPDVTEKKRGRRKKKRIPNTGSIFTRAIQCGNCHTKARDNRNTCPHPPAKKPRLLPSA